MALTPQEELEQLKKLGQQLGRLGQISNEWLQDSAKYVDDIVRKSLEWEDEIKLINSDLYGLKSILEANLGELTNGNTQLLKARKNTRDLISITQQLSNDQAGILDLNKQQVEKLIQKTKIANDELRAVSINRDLTQEQRDAALDNLKLGEQVLVQAQQRLEFENKITKALGLTNGVAIGLQKTMRSFGMEKLSEQLGLDDAILKTREYTKELIRSQQQNGNTGGIGTDLLNNLKTAGNLVKNLGANLMKSIGPVAIIAGLVDALMSLDKTVGNTAKQFGISYDNSRKLTEEVNKIAYNTDNIYVDSQKLNQSFLELSEILGTNTMLSEDMLVNYTQLTQQAGYSKESAATMSKLSLLTSKSSKDIAANFLGQVKAQNAKNGLAINEKTLLNDINNISKATLLTYTAQGKELGTASAQAKMLGSDLKQLESISQSLLDIESSISAEFESEVMTGKQLNLERARYFALTSNLGGLAEELNKQGITFANFGKMNVLQQEAQAKAMGMSRDEMANMLMEGEALNKIGAKNKEEARARYNELVKIHGVEGAIKQLGDEQLAQQFESNDKATEFQAALAKLQDIFTQMAEPLLPILDIFVGIAKAVGFILSPLTALMSWAGEVSGPLKTVVSLLVAAGAAALFMNGSLTLGIGVATALAAVAVGMAALKKETTPQKVNDAQFSSNDGLIVSGPKGSIQLDKEDTFIGNKDGIVAGTNLGGKKENTPIQSSESSITVLSSTLGNKMDVMINKLDNLITAVNKGMTVNLDGNKVSQNILTPLAINNRRV